MNEYVNNKILEYAYAKVNLLLDVTSKREDGYHNLNSIVMPIDLYDEIWMEKAKRMSYKCNDKSLPFDDSNTIVKAVKLMKETFRIKDNYRIKITKNIPKEAGLGGGSSDAAAVMRGILKLSNPPTNLSYLEELGLKIGADVPACVSQKSVLVSGVGKVIAHLPHRFDFVFLLIKPKQGISTKLVYDSLNLDTCVHPKTNTMLLEWKRGNSDGIYKYSENALEETTFQLVPELVELKQELLSYGFKTVTMSGSGTTLFAAGKSVFESLEIAENFKKRYPFVHVACSYPAPKEFNPLFDRRNFAHHFIY